MALYLRARLTRAQILFLQTRPRSVEILVTENGFSDRLGNTDDLQRIYYYKHYINQLLKGERRELQLCARERSVR